MYRHTARRADGYEISTGPLGTIERDTKQCCHCGGHFQIIPGSGKTRGFCLKCTKVTCGNPACNEHFSIEERMDLFEKGLLPELMGTRDTMVPKHKRFIIEG